MVDEGVSVQPLVNFMGNLMENPSKVAVDELYLFLESCKSPITEDGYFIAYKIVRNDYMDVYSGKFNNARGVTVSMERNEVDDNRNNTCSQGLHFCSRGYLNSYSSHDRETDRCMLVKINPADVVSIPSDYNNAKGRTWRYEVVGEVTDNEWRKSLSENDYTSKSVVDSSGEEYTCQDELDDDLEDLEDGVDLDDRLDLVDQISEYGFLWIEESSKWWNSKKHRYCSRRLVAEKTGFSEEDLQTVEV
jgi:hypothetical protein